MDDDWTKQMAGSEVLSSTIFDPSSVRMSNQSAVAMKWKCSDMRHHLWTRTMNLVPDLSIKFLIFGQRLGQATGQTRGPVIHYI